MDGAETRLDVNMIEEAKVARMRDEFSYRLAKIKD
jgi:hypothetical protein